MSVSRFRSSLVLTTALGSLLAGAACTGLREDAPVRFLRSADDAGSCSKVADVTAPAKVSETDVIASLANEARKKGADTVVLPKGERTGAAYRCEAPAVAKKS